jgi:hypothetical protein
MVMRKQEVMTDEDYLARIEVIERSVAAGERTADEGTVQIGAVMKAATESWLRWTTNPDDPYLVRCLKEDEFTDKRCLAWLQRNASHLIWWDTPHGVLECCVMPENYGYPVVHLVRPSVAKVLAHARRLVAEEGWALFRGDFDNPEE